MNIKILFITNLYSGLKKSLQNKEWLPEGMPAIYKLLEFLGDNKGLLIAEVELESEGQHIALPDWIDSEVTNQNKYFNYNLALKPYISW